MREILFRAKTADENEWIYGDIFHSGAYPKIVRIHDYKNRVNYAVNPETVGEFIGLTDNNGFKIFEGDIVKSRITGEKFIVVWDELYSAFAIRNSKVRYGFPKCNVKTYQVVGNVHDNPELIKDGD